MVSAKIAGAALITGLVLVSLLFWAHSIYAGIFRLSKEDVLISLQAISSSCDELRTCSLLPGDILIRRYITPRTRIFDSVAHPYFTHSAWYLGDDELFEAMGTEKRPEDDIQVSKFSTSDWMDTGIETFVIIRPKNITETFPNIEQNLRDIAADPLYQFGLSDPKSKRGACADLIFGELLRTGAVTPFRAPKVVTPDYLFSMALHAPADFEIIGKSGRVVQ